MCNKSNGFYWRGRMGYWGREDSPKRPSASSTDRREPRDYCDEYCDCNQDKAEIETFKTFVRTVGWCLILIGTTLII